jgi:hypothetical protein
MALRAGHVAQGVLALLLAACGGDTPSPSLSTQTTTGPTSSPTSGPAPTEEPISAFAGAWMDVTAEAIGETGDYTNRVELADVDGDGRVDLLFANGGNYDAPGEPVSSRVFTNLGDGTFDDATERVLGEHALLTRVIELADLDGDRDLDIVLGTTYDTQSRLLRNEGDGSWVDVTESNLPAANLSAGDLEIGDVDGDHDLDIVIADWGDDGPLTEGGGRVMLWLNDGAATFTDATDQRMPETLVGFSWDLELVDVDNDWDLDIAVSCKLCTTSRLYMNDSSGTFTDETEGRLPPFPNNYEFAPIDLDGDGFLDLVTINDGSDTPRGLAEHAFHNDGNGAFVDATPDWWSGDANPGWDDAIVVALDVESDGDADFLIASLDGPDRLLINDGSGFLTMADDVFDTTGHLGTLDFGLADLNGDGRLDVVEAQGEVPGHETERVYFGTDVLPPDTAPPIIREEVKGGLVLARVHDNRTPNVPHDWQAIVCAGTVGNLR